MSNVVEGVVSTHSRSTTVVIQHSRNGLWTIKGPRVQGSGRSLTRALEAYAKRAGVAHGVAAQLADEAGSSLAQLIKESQ